MDDNRYENEGGCAFPFTEQGVGGETTIASPGMTLRDWFAGQALGNLAICTGHAEDWQLTSWFGPHRTNISRCEIVARQAGDYADAMLATRAPDGVDGKGER